MSMFYHLDWNLAFANRKPDGSIVINWNDPITEGLEFFTMITDKHMVDLVTGDYASLTGDAEYTAQRLRTTYSGAGLATWGNRNTVSSDSRTMISAALPTTSNGQTFEYYMSIAGGLEFTNLLGTTNVTAPRALQITWGSAGYKRTAEGFVPLGERHVYAASKGPGTSHSNAYLYKDGILFTGTHHAEVNGAVDSTYGDLYLGGRPSGSRYLNGFIEFGAYWSRQLSHDEVFRASNNINYLIESRY